MNILLHFTSILACCFMHHCFSDNHSSNWSRKWLGKGDFCIKARAWFASKSACTMHQQWGGSGTARKGWMCKFSIGIIFCVFHTIIHVFIIVYYFIVTVVIVIVVIVVERFSTNLWTKFVDYYYNFYKFLLVDLENYQDMFVLFRSQS